VRPRVADFRCRILDNGLFILNLSGSCGLVMTHLSPTGEWLTHSSLLSHSNSLCHTKEGAKTLMIKRLNNVYSYIKFLLLSSSEKSWSHSIYRVIFDLDFIASLADFMHHQTFIQLISIKLFGVSEDCVTSMQLLQHCTKRISRI